MDMNVLRYQLRFSALVIQRNTEGLTHEESLTQPAPAGNCLNWVLGHLVRSRNEALAVAGREPRFPAEELATYERGGVWNPARALPLEELLSRFAALQEPLEQAVTALDAEALAAPAPFSPSGNPEETVGTLLSGIGFHEAYHVGQTGLLRRLLGKPGAIA